MSEQIVFLDSSTVDYGDISLASIEALGKLVVHEFTTPAQTADRIADASVIITNKVKIDAEVLKRCPKLKFIAIAATGFDHVDIGAARAAGIGVANVAGYSTDAVAQLTLALILGCATSLVKYNKAAHDGTWSSWPIFTMNCWPTFEVSGKTLGIIGYGAIGSAVGRLAAAFGMQVIAWGREGEDYGQNPPRYSLDELAAQSDFISLHLPLSPESNLLVDDKFLAQMKPTAYLINMARGAVVDNRALAMVLQEGKIAGAAVDVMEQEPPPPDHPLIGLENCIITPHIGWGTVQARQTLVDEMAVNIETFVTGGKRNRLDTKNNI
jgi:glycerate dehydrogenase